MTEQQNFFDFFNEFLEDRNFDTYLLLGFIPERLPPLSKWRREWEDIWAETDPEGRNWTRTPETAEECLERWLKESRIKRDPRGDGGNDYLYLEECRAYGHIRFHVMIDNFGGGECGIERLLWREISGGWAFPRLVGDRIGGLIGHLVMRAGYPLTLNCGGFQGRYTSADFKPWRPKP